MKLDLTNLLKSESRSMPQAEREGRTMKFGKNEMKPKFENKLDEKRVSEGQAHESNASKIQAKRKLPGLRITRNGRVAIFP